MMAITVKLPRLILDTQPATALRMLAYASNPRVANAEFDARDLTAIEPVGVCLFASAVRRARLAAKSVVIRHACPTLHRLLESVKDDVTWASSKANSALTMRPTLAMAIATQAEANAITNKMSAELARFVPAEDRQAMEDQYGLRIYHAVQPALAYVLTELVDNVFCIRGRSISRIRPPGWPPSGTCTVIS
jgi:hypothetical protein